MKCINFLSGWRQILQTLVGAVFPSLVYTTEGEKRHMHPMSKLNEKMYRDMAYFHVQSVLPDSYGYGMVDSPVGLIGWIGINLNSNLLKFLLISTFRIIFWDEIKTIFKISNHLSGSAYPMVSCQKDLTKNLMANLSNGVTSFGIDNICAMISIFWCVRSAQASMRWIYNIASCQVRDLCYGVPTDMALP